MARGTARERFWDKVHCEPNTGCWLWAGAYGGRGYGSFCPSGKTVKAHRFSYEMHVAPIPAGLLVLHKCDVRLCVNPGHLYVGTYADNSRDALVRRRHVVGERHPRSKLTKKEVIEIRASDMSHRRLAAKHGVGETTIRRVRSRTSWRHV